MSATAIDEDDGGGGCALYTIDGLHIAGSVTPRHDVATDAHDVSPTRSSSSNNNDNNDDTHVTVASATPAMDVGQQLCVLYRLFLRLHHAGANDMAVDKLLKPHAATASSTSTTRTAGGDGDDAARTRGDALARQQPRRNVLRANDDVDDDDDDEDDDDHDDDMNAFATRDVLRARALTRPPSQQSVVNEAERWLLCSVPAPLRRVTVCPYFLLPSTTTPAVHRLCGYADTATTRRTYGTSQEQPQQQQQQLDQPSRVRDDDNNNNNNSNRSANGADELLVRCGVVRHDGRSGSRAAGVIAAAAVAAAAAASGGASGGLMSSSSSSSSSSLMSPLSPWSSREARHDGASDAGVTDAALSSCVPAELVVATSRHCWSCVAVRLGATEALTYGDDVLVFCCTRQ